MITEGLRAAWAWIKLASFVLVGFLLGAELAPRMIDAHTNGGLILGVCCYLLLPFLALTAIDQLRTDLGRGKGERKSK